MWLEEKGRKRRLRRARIVSLLKRIRFYWSMVIFLRNFKQQSGMIIFVFRRQPGGSSMEDGWEKAKGEKPDLLAG